MAIPSPRDILTVSSDYVGDFIQHHTNSKTLSVMIRHLNRDLLEGDESASEMAARALDHLGFAADAHP